MKHTGTIRWFDSKSGEGFVRRDSDQKSFFVHFTSIAGMDKNNHHWPTEHDQVKFSCIDGLPCEFEMIEDTHFVQVKSLVLVEEVSNDL